MPGLNQTLEFLVNQNNKVIKCQDSYSFDLINKFLYTIDQHGEYHSINNNPAIIYPEKYIEIWMHHGKIHRINGPAIKIRNIRYYYLENIMVASDVGLNLFKFNGYLRRDLSFLNHIVFEKSNLENYPIIKKYLKSIIFTSNFPKNDKSYLNYFNNLTTLGLMHNFNMKLDSLFDELTNLENLSIGEYNPSNIIFLIPDPAMIRNIPRHSTNEINSLFNNPLDNSLKNLINLKKLHIEGKFNYPFNKSLWSLINLEEFTIVGKYNQPFKKSLNKLTKLKVLKLHCDYNYEFEDSLYNLQELNYLEIGNAHYFNFHQELGHSLRGLSKLLTLRINEGRINNNYDKSYAGSFKDVNNNFTLRINGIGIFELLKN